MLEPIRTVEASVTGQVDAGRGRLVALNLTAAAVAATAVVRTGGAAGAVIARVSAPVGTSVPWKAPGVLQYSDLHVTLGGAGAVLSLYL